MTIHCVTDEEPVWLKVTRLLNIRFRIRVICTQVLSLPGCPSVTLDKGFKFSMVHFLLEPRKQRDGGFIPTLPLTSSEALRK